LNCSEKIKKEQFDFGFGILDFELRNSDWHRREAEYAAFFMKQAKTPDVLAASPRVNPPHGGKQPPGGNDH
jgi:hypothetical protein